MMNHLLAPPFLLLSLCSLFISSTAMSFTAMAGETVSYEVDGLSAVTQLAPESNRFPYTSVFQSLASSSS